MGNRSIPERLANEYLEWDKNVHILSKFKRHVATKKDSEVDRAEIERAVWAVQGVWEGEKPCIPELFKDVEEIFQEAGIESRDQIRVILLGKWCKELDTTYNHRGRPKRANVSAPYLRPAKDEEPVFLEN